MPENDDPSPSAKLHSVRAALRSLVTSVAFLEKVLLLCLTALISGLAVPLIISELNNQSTAQQKDIDRAKNRNETLQQAKAKLFQDFSEVAVSYQVLALDVSWFGMPTYKKPRNAE